MRIALAHPGVSPYVQQTARALLEAGLLESYWTTYIDRPEMNWRRALVRLASAVNFDIERELNRRAIKEIPVGVVKTMPYWEIARTLLTRLGVDSRLVDAVWEWETLQFDRSVARRSLKGVDGIYGYEFSTLATFEEAQRRGLARIYEIPSAELDFMENLIRREIEEFPELDDGRRKYFWARQARRAERRRQEFTLADIVIANSTFTRDSYAAAGLDVSKVRVVPLGAPPVQKTKGILDGNSEREPLRVLWAGGFSIHKGAHYLLSAWEQIASENAATLDIYGAVLLPQKLLGGLPASIRFRGTIPRVELFEQYRKADVLVFPTLCDGFGMVVTEAFAYGLPVITTKRAGAADLVRHRANGLIVPAGDAQALAEALEWCVTHRSELSAMRQTALETARSWQWADYRLALSCHVREGLKEAGYAS